MASRRKARKDKVDLELKSANSTPSVKVGSTSGLSIVPPRQSMRLSASGKREKFKTFIQQLRKPDKRPGEEQDKPLKKSQKGTPGQSQEGRLRQTKKGTRPPTKYALKKDGRTSLQLSDASLVRPPQNQKKDSRQVQSQQAGGLNIPMEFQPKQELNPRVQLKRIDIPDSKVCVTSVYTPNSSKAAVLQDHGVRLDETVGKSKQLVVESARSGPSGPDIEASNNEQLQDREKNQKFQTLIQQLTKPNVMLENQEELSDSSKGSRQGIPVQIQQGTAVRRKRGTAWPRKCAVKDENQSNKKSKIESELFETTTTELSTSYLSRIGDNGLDCLQRLCSHVGVQMVAREDKVTMQGSWEALAEVKKALVQLMAEGGAPTRSGFLKVGTSSLSVKNIPLTETEREEKDTEVAAGEEEEEEEAAEAAAEEEEAGEITSVVAPPVAWIVNEDGPGESNPNQKQLNSDPIYIIFQTPETKTGNAGEDSESGGNVSFSVINIHNSIKDDVQTRSPPDVLAPTPTEICSAAKAQEKSETEPAEDKRPQRNTSRSRFKTLAECKLIIQCSLCKKLWNTGKNLKRHVCKGEDTCEGDKGSEPVGTVVEVPELTDDYSVGLKDCNENNWFKCLSCSTICKERDEMYEHIKKDHFTENLCPLRALAREKLAEIVAPNESEAHSGTDGEEGVVQSTPGIGLIHIPISTKSTLPPHRMTDVCDICGFKTSKYGLFKHKKNFHSRFLFSCDICGRGAFVLVRAWKHYQSHFDKNGFELQISIIELVFTNVKDHFKCRLCGTVLEKRSDRFPHSHICLPTAFESKGRLHKCKKCDYKTERLKFAVEHYSHRHSHIHTSHTQSTVQYRYRYRCKGCSGSWRSRQGWVAHLLLCKGLDHDFAQKFRKTALCRGKLKKEIVVCPDCDRNLTKCITRRDGTIDHTVRTKKPLSEGIYIRCCVCNEMLDEEEEHSVYGPPQKALTDETTVFAECEYTIPDDNTLQAVKDDDVFKCNACSSSYDRRENWLAHVKECQDLDHAFRVGFLQIAAVSERLPSRVMVCSDCDNALSKLVTRPDGSVDGLKKSASDDSEDPSSEANSLKCEICLKECGNHGAMTVYVESKPRDIITCKECHRMFPDHEDLKSHRCIRYLHEPIGRCEEFPEESTQEYLLMRDEEQNVWYQCRGCPLLLGLRPAVLSHWRSTHSKDPSVPFVIVPADSKGEILVEDEDDQTVGFKNPGRPWLMEMCPEKATHKCPHCPFMTSRAGLKYHMARHHPKFFYKCTVCGLCCGRLTQLILHFKTHSSVKTKKPVDSTNMKKRTLEVMSRPPAITCRQCHKKLRRTNELTNHLKHCRGQKFSIREGLHWCSECDFKTKIYRNFFMHYARQHGKRDLICEMCGKCFALKNDLEQHRKTHGQMRTYKCKFCEKTFKNSSHLREHIQYHTDPNTYQCPICSRSFKLKRYLRGHMRIHDGRRNRGKIFKCSHCDKCFVSAYGLLEHSHQHTGVPRYKCKDCGDTFLYRWAFRKHGAKFHGRKVHTCSICQKKYFTTDGLKYHKCSGYRNPKKTSATKKRNETKPSEMAASSAGLEDTMGINLESADNVVIYPQMGVDVQIQHEMAESGGMGKAFAGELAATVALETSGQVITERIEQVVFEGSEQVVTEGVTQVVFEGSEQVVTEEVAQVVFEGSEQVVTEEVVQVVFEGSEQVVTEEVAQVVFEGSEQVVTEGVGQGVFGTAEHVAEGGSGDVISEETPVYMCAICRELILTWESVEAHMLQHDQSTPSTEDDHQTAVLTEGASLLG